MWVGWMFHMGQFSAHHSAPLTIHPPTGAYCSVASYGGQMLSFYRTKPGTTTQAGDMPVWVIMVPHRSDPYLAWWTPEFPYWERANQRDGFIQNGQTYAKFQNVEVLPIWSDPWEPLSTVFVNHPTLTGGPAAEAVERQQLIEEWSIELGSPVCG